MTPATLRLATMNIVGTATMKSEQKFSGNRHLKSIYTRIRSKKKPHEHFSNEHSLQMSKLRKPVNTLAIKNSNTKDFVHVCHYHMAQGVVSTKLKKYERKKHLKISRRLTKFRIASHAEGSGLEPTA